MTSIIFFYRLHPHSTSTDALSLAFSALPYPALDSGTFPSGFIQFVCVCTLCWYSGRFIPLSPPGGSGA